MYLLWLSLTLMRIVNSSTLLASVIHSAIEHNVELMVFLQNACLFVFFFFHSFRGRFVLSIYLARALCDETFPFHSFCSLLFPCDKRQY